MNRKVTVNMIFKNYKKMYKELKSELETSNNETEDYKVRLVKAENKIEKLKKENESLKSENEDLIKAKRLEINDLKVKLEIKENLNRSLNRTLASKNGKLGGLGSARAKAIKKLNKSEQEKVMLQNTIQELARENKRLRNKPTLQEIKDLRRKK